MRLKRLLPAVLIFASALNGCGDGRQPLVLYSPHGRDLLILVEETFEAAHPEVDVRWLDMGSQEVYDRVRSETANPQCDVWFGGPATILGRGAEDGLLEPYRPPWADAIPEGGRHPKDLYFALYRTPPILVFNEDVVSAEDAPHDWDDLLDERWKGKVLVRDPLASGTMRTIFGMVLAKSVTETGDAAAGFDWLRRLDAQTKEYVHSPALLHQKIVRQEGLVTLWELTDILFQRLRGSHLGYRFPTSGSPVIDDSIALVRGSRHPQEARAFIDWVGSREAQLLTAEKAFRLPARTDLSSDELPPWAREALAELVTAEVNWALVEEKGAEWMNQWDREVRGRGVRK
jgi:iron(III) transport system substrate-binding protein